MNNRTAAALGAGALVMVLAVGVTFMTSEPDYVEPHSARGDIDRFKIQFIQPDYTDTTDRANFRSRPKLLARPPHHTWDVNRNLYNCRAVDSVDPEAETNADSQTCVPSRENPLPAESLNGTLIECETDIPSEWGCAAFSIGIQASWDDPEKGPVDVVTPIGTFVEQPRIRARAMDSTSEPLICGTCPDPPLEVIVVPEPSMSLALLAGALCLCIFELFSIFRQ